MLAATAAANREDDFEAWIDFFQGNASCDAAFCAVNRLLKVCIFVKELESDLLGRTKLYRIWLDLGRHTEMDPSACGLALR